MASTLAPLAAVWAYSCLVASPALVFSTTSPYPGGEATACVLVWPDGDPSISLMDHVYQVPPGGAIKCRAANDPSVVTIMEKAPRLVG